MSVWKWVKALWCLDVEANLKKIRKMIHVFRLALPDRPPRLFLYLFTCIYRSTWQCETWIICGSCIFFCKCSQSRENKIRLQSRFYLSSKVLGFFVTKRWIWECLHNWNFPMQWSVHMCVRQSPSLFFPFIHKQELPIDCITCTAPVWLSLAAWWSFLAGWLWRPVRISGPHL